MASTGEEGERERALPKYPLIGGHRGGNLYTPRVSDGGAGLGIPQGGNPTHPEVTEGEGPNMEGKEGQCPNP